MFVKHAQTRKSASTSLLFRERSHGRHLAPLQFQAPLAGTFTAFAQIFPTRRRRARERHELAPLDHRTISDLGLSEGSALRFEANKPFWRD